MLPSLPRRFSTSALLRNLPTTTSSSLAPIPRPPTVTLSRQYTYYDPHSSIELLPSSSSSTAKQESHTWPPYTRRTLLTSYALPYQVYAAEALKARREGMVLDPRNHVQRAVKAEVEVEVRRETVAGCAPGEGEGEGGGGMELLEGEVAERWAEEAGAVLALEGGADGGLKGLEKEKRSGKPEWRELERWWTREYPDAEDWSAAPALTAEQKYAQWMECMEDLRVDGAFELERERGEVFAWAEHRWGEDLGSWPEEVKGWLKGEGGKAGEEKRMWSVEL